MKSLFSLVIFILAGCLVVNAQCDPDYTFYPTEYNFGLSPDSLPNGIVSQEYDVDLTFVLPQDTTIEGFYVVFEDYHITSISLPIGLNWECNNSSNDCHYNPVNSQYGCVNISGTPLVAGDYFVQVQVVATHDLSYLVGTETISFELPMIVEPDNFISSNAGFDMIVSSGCDEVMVEFINNIPDLSAYSWNFGNGMISNVEDPGGLVYNTPGEYLVTYEAYETTESLYFLNSIEVVIAEGWGGDVEDWFTAPDPYFKMYDESGNEVYSSSVQVDNDFPVSWNVGNISLLNQSYSIVVWDQDGTVTDDDNLGSVSFNGFSNSGTSVNGALSVNYTITEIPPTPISYDQLVTVNGEPNAPDVVFEDGVLSSDFDALYTSGWLYNGAQLDNAFGSSYTPINSGWYSLYIVDENGCTNTSEEVLVVICDPDASPVLQADNMMAFVADSVLYSDFQWYYEGEILNEQTESYTEASISGFYHITALDSFGCSYSSDSILICDDMEVVVGVNGDDETIWVVDSLNYGSFVWMKDGDIINGATNGSYTIASSGYYSVAVVDDYGCSYNSGQTILCVKDFKPNLSYEDHLFWTSDSVGFEIQWYMNGLPIDGETNALCHAEDIGVGYYAVQITDNYGCSYVSDVLSYTDLEEQILAQKINLFPNPTSDYIMLDVNVSDMSLLSIEVSDLLGRKIKDVRNKSKMHQLDFSNLENGIYFVNFFFEEDVVVTKKVVKN